MINYNTQYIYCVCNVTSLPTYELSTWKPQYDWGLKSVSRKHYNLKGIKGNKGRERVRDGQLGPGVSERRDPCQGGGRSPSL